jgi:hypothetical protein
VSLEDLEADLTTNLAAAAQLLGPLVTASDIAKHLNETMWPFVVNVVTELKEVDETVADLYHGAEDILQPETAKVFAAVIAVASGLILGELKRRLDPNKPSEAKLLAAIKEWARLAHEAGETLEEITVVPAEGGEDEEDEDDEDDVGDDDEDNEDDDDAEDDKEPSQ